MCSMIIFLKCASSSILFFPRLSAAAFFFKNWWSNAFFCFSQNAQIHKLYSLYTSYDFIFFSCCCSVATSIFKKLETRAMIVTKNIGCKSILRRLGSNITFEPRRFEKLEDRTKAACSKIENFCSLNDLKRKIYQAVVSLLDLKTW